MRGAASFVGVLTLALLAPAAASADAPDAVLAPSEALQCLTPAAATLAYPEQAYSRKEGGTISVELRFAGPDEVPHVKVLNRDTSDALEEAVRRHVSTFRVPCMKAGGPPVVLRQDYVFIPTDGRRVLAGAPKDEADEHRRAQMRCLMQTRREKMPLYPREDERYERQGNVLLRLTFTAPDQAPKLQTLARPGEGHFLDAAREFASGFRLPCLADAELSMDMLFHFRMEGAPRKFLKDMSLPQFVRAAKSYPTPAYFDLATMDCPFDVRLDYRRPYTASKVGQLDTVNPARQPFLEWLTQITLALPESTNIALLGAEFTLHVPCGKVDL
jgi:hypothetical protein